MIRKLFQALFGWPCDHDWETLIENEGYEVAYPGFLHENGEPYKEWGDFWLYRCKKCCKSKEIKS